jgi:hypothetical protein
LIACQSLSGSSEKLVSVEHEGASRRTALKRDLHLLTGRLRDAKPRPQRHDIFTRIRQQFRQRRRVVGLAQHDAGERAGVYGHRVPWTRESDESGPRAQRRRRREPRRAGE